MMTLKKTTLLAIAGLGFASQAASAATAVSIAGDLFLGFRQIGNPSTYILNLGQVSVYRDATAGFSLNLGNVGSDLTSLFGAGWNNDATVYWGIAGYSGLTANTGDVPRVLYASKPETILGVPETGYVRFASGGQGVAGAYIAAMQNTYTGQTTTANSTVGIIQAASVDSGWAFFNPGEISFNTFASMEGTFGAGTSNAALDLFRMQPSTTSGLLGTYEGTFTISNAGSVAFGPTSLVPEPSSALLLIAGTGILGLARRRRAALAA